MDNICHTLVGAAIGEADLKRRTRYAQATLMIAANLPDLDVLVFLTDTAPISFRRGWTHGVAAQIVLPAVLAGLMWGIGRWRLREDAAGDRPPLHLGWLLALSYIGLYSHVFLDFLNNYGVRLLAPLDWRWFYGDAVFIIDPWLWLALGVGVWLARRRQAAVFARASLAFTAGYVVVMLLSSRAALDVVGDVWTQARGTSPREVMVGPVAVTPFLRAVIVDAGDRYETGVFNWWSGGVTFAPRAIPKNAANAAVPRAIAQSHEIREFLVWARYPFWRIENGPQGTAVTVGDMRFADAGGIRGAQFTASTVLTPASSADDAASPDSSRRTNP